MKRRDLGALLACYAIVWIPIVILILPERLWLAICGVFS